MAGGNGRLVKETKRKRVRGEGWMEGVCGVKERVGV